MPPYIYLNSLRWTQTLVVRLTETELHLDDSTFLWECGTQCPNSSEDRVELDAYEFFPVVSSGWVRWLRLSCESRWVKNTLLNEKLIPPDFLLLFINVYKIKMFYYLLSVLVLLPLVKAGIELVFIGTGAGGSSRLRGSTSMALRLNGKKKTNIYINLALKERDILSVRRYERG